MGFPINGSQGICYAPYPPGYDPSTANQTWIFFGSDIAQNAMAPLWNVGYKNAKGQDFVGRDDFTEIKKLGVNLIRLYDWEPRNRHEVFLERCSNFGNSLLAPVSNYFLKEGFSKRREHIPNLIRSFSNAQGTDYHRSITGIIIGNEPRISGYSVNDCIQFTNDYAQVEQSMFGSYRKLPIGHPVDFALYGGQYPCWGFWDPLVGGTSSNGLANRTFLAPQTYNSAEYLFNTVGNGQPGYVDLTWARYQKPILFTEIGLGRDKPGHAAFVKNQLRGCINYRAGYPDRLPGFCFFQFADKSWKRGESEGMFGAFEQTNRTVAIVQYSAGDFTHHDVPEPNPDQMIVNGIQQSDLYDPVYLAYNNL